MNTSLLFDIHLANDGVAWPSLPPGLAVHRLLHAPTGTPEAAPADTLDPEALRVAGRFEPRDTERRLAMLAKARADYPDLTHWLVFDTPFFDALPDTARYYALPTELTAEHGLYRTGRHGPVHRRAAQPGRCVTVALTASLTVAAIVDGRPLEISGGLSGLEGVPGNTTVGDIDPAAILYLVDALGMSLDDVERALWDEGGYAGVAAGGDNDLASGLIRHRLRRAIGSAVAVMDGLDSLVFSGEARPGAFDEVIAGLTYLGLGDMVPVLHVDWTPLTAAADAVMHHA